MIGVLKMKSEKSSIPNDVFITHQIGKMLNGKEPKFVNGPEVFAIEFSRIR
jgi:hypothetical protein